LGFPIPPPPTPPPRGGGGHSVDDVEYDRNDVL